jgi:acyl-CoA thioester hydrolase
MRDSAIPVPYESTLTVKSDWLDANGHMNVAYYLSAFDDGGEVFFRDCGIGWDYTAEGQGTLFMSSSDLDFKRELFRGDRLRVETILIDWTPKLIHTFQTLLHADDGFFAASAEILFVHVAFGDRKSAPMPSAAQSRLAAVERVHRGLPRPKN